MRRGAFLPIGDELVHVSKLPRLLLPGGSFRRQAGRAAGQHGAGNPRLPLANRWMIALSIKECEWEGIHSNNVPSLSLYMARTINAVELPPRASLRRTGRCSSFW